MRPFTFVIASILTLLTLPSWAKSSTTQASYEVRVVSLAPPRLAVQATLPVSGAKLLMATSRPGDVAELNDGGWPVLVKDLTCSGPDGKPISLTRAGPEGWTLEGEPPKRLTLSYVVDYALLAERGWPAAREAAYADARQAVVVGRSLFVTTPGQRESVVRFAVPDGWTALAPWTESSGGSWRVPSPEDLVENLIAFTRGGTEDLTAGPFRFHVIPFRRWESARAAVRRVIQGPIAGLAKMMGQAEPASYNLVLLPISETGGESFRSSFALSTEAAPSGNAVEEWGSLIAHEFFHYWNGWRLRGADYASTNWFREGFTEYIANVAMVEGGMFDERWLRGKLARHVDNYARLATPLDAPGDHKGPPLYSGGALVAFCWDARVREGTRGEKSIADVFRALWKRTDRGTRPYAWEDIKASLDSVLRADWDDFHRKHIHGREPLPFVEAFASMGLSVKGDAEASAVVSVDPAAPAEARSRWTDLTHHPRR